MRNLLGEQIFTEIVRLCPIDLICELRLRLHMPIHIKTMQKEYFTQYVCTEKYLEYVFQNAVKGSKYACEREISYGYIDYDDGVRIGIVGKGKINEKNIVAFQKTYAFCIRFPHEIIGLSEKVLSVLSPFENTLVVAPPGCGKTTLIRDMARVLSARYDTLYIDERGELCGNGISMTVGKKADVIQGVRKEFVFENVIRSMSPQIIVCDELFSEKDALSVKKIIHSGIKCLASFHGKKICDVPKNIAESFDTFILLCDSPQTGTIRQIERQKHA